MSAFSSQHLSQRHIKHDPFLDIPTANSRSSSGAASAGPSTGNIAWNSTGPMLRFEDAVVETVVTHTTRTTTSFAPVPLPRIPMPETIPRPDHLASALYPLAQEPSPEELRVFTVNLGGQRVVIQEDNTAVPENEYIGVTSGPGWTRTVLGVPSRPEGERLGLVEAVNRSKGKEVRKRPYDFSTTPSRSGAIQRMIEAPTPPITADSGSRPRRSPPRKKIRGLDDLTIPHDGSSALLSPLPSPEHEAGPSTAAPPASTPGPSVGTGVELAALFSLPSLVSHFEDLPDKLQQQVLMNLLRRSRMPTIQKIYGFAGLALKRDFVSQLPHEIAVQIVKNIDVTTLPAASRVSRKWHKMIDSERSVWQQKLIDNDLWSGLGVEEEEEQLMTRRMETLEWKARQRMSKAGSPIDDVPMRSARSPSSPVLERPVPLKHVFRRRYCASKNWLNTRPEHTSFPGHGTNVITCLQFDADKIVSASDDHSINIYNTATGQLRRRLDGHEGGVWALEYKGDTLVSGSTDRTVRIWDLATLMEAHVFHGHTSTVRCLQIVEPVYDPKTGEYYPPCPMIVTGSRDATLRVWKLPKKGEPPMIQLDETGEPAPVPPEENPWHVHVLEGHTSAVRALAAYGRICISGSYDSTVRVWDIVTGQCRHVFTGHEQKVYSIVYDRHRNRCASGSMDNTVKVWDVATGQCLHTLTGHTSLVGLLGTSPNFLVSAAADASLRVWDANTHELKHTLASHGGAITCFQHDETKVISGSDGSLKLWDIRTGQYVRDLVIGSSSVWQVAFNGNLIVAASNRNGTTIFDVFDFGGAKYRSGLDDPALDTLRRPRWERSNPREPQSYQVEEIDGVELSSPTDFIHHLTSPEAFDRYVRDSSTSSRHHGTGASRRSSRLAAKSIGNTTLRGGLNYEHGSVSQRYKRSGILKQELTSPSPVGRAGPSHQIYGVAAGDSFVPMFDDEREEMDEDVKEEYMD